MPDDLNLSSSSVSSAKTLLYWCTKALKWAGLDCWADKSRRIIISKGRSMNTTPSLCTRVKNLFWLFILYTFQLFQTNKISGPYRIIGSSISVSKSLDELEKKLIIGGSIINKSVFNGTQKLYILQHLLIPRIPWPLLIYEVPISHVTKLEQKISSFIRKWLHLHKPISSLCFYSKAPPCPLLNKSLTSVHQSAKISGLFIMFLCWY